MKFRDSISEQPAELELAPMIDVDYLLLILIIVTWPDQAVILRGASEANFQSIFNVLDQIKIAGIWNVAFATTKP